MIRTVAAALAAFFASAGTAVAAAGGCHSFSGTFTAVAPAGCTSPVGICTHGTLVGGFPSTYDFVADTLVPASPTTGAYTGHSTITAANGAVIYGNDHGVLDFTNGNFVTTVEIAGGTRQYAHATGSFVAPGVLDLATGDTVGSYTATICLGIGPGD